VAALVRVTQRIEGRTFLEGTMKANVLDMILTRQSEAHAAGNLNVWTVYDHPKDFPETYVARRFLTLPSPVATDDVVQGDLPAIRDAFHRCGLVCLSRNDGDEPQIVESWI
jgi:hypothetical protein